MVTWVVLDETHTVLHFYSLDIRIGEKLGGQSPALRTEDYFPACTLFLLLNRPPPNNLLSPFNSMLPPEGAWSIIPLDWSPKKSAEGRNAFKVLPMVVPVMKAATAHLCCKKSFYHVPVRRQKETSCGKYNVKQHSRCCIGLSLCDTLSTDRLHFSFNRNKGMSKT